MKHLRFLSLLLALLMMLSLAACGGNDSVETETETPTEEVTDLIGETDTETETSTDDYAVISIAEALELCGEEAGYITTDRYYIRGTVVTITDARYGAMVITDGTDSISVYGTYSADGSIGYADMAERPYKGDEVLLHCILQNFDGTKEIKNARLISFVSHQGDIDVSTYTAATIAEARAAEKGALLKVSGVVARITYANGMKPSGFILVNGADSIYVYDGDVAIQVAIGNTVEIAGAKTYWVRESEQADADKFGYKGCNQLENPILISNDKGDSEWINANIPTSTVKDMLETPVTEDVTTKVFKVNALVKEVEDDGFTNFYFYDLDGETGSYAYTQCNGGDFTWLREFDGKICTVYLTALNAKSTASDCYFRLLPVAVIDEGYTFNTDDAAQYAVTYHGIPQFQPSYSGDPELELTTTVSSALLGFEGATLSYTSGNTDVIIFTEVNGKVTMNCIDAGTATVTVTGKYNGITAEATFDITVVTADSVDSVDVKTAIDADNNTEVAVKGIVGPALANQTGFYLIDGTGAIAVRTTSDVLKTLQLGYEVIIKGTRTVTKEGAGQICIDNATVAYNGYGENAILATSFITDKTVSDLCGLDDDIAHTVEVYVTTATIKRVDGQHSTNTYVSDGQNDLMLYSGGKGDYAWVEDYVGQELTVIVAVCDWNGKGNRGALLGIALEDGTIIYNTNYRAG